MKIKTTTAQNRHRVTLSDEELDAIQLAISLMLDNEHTHPDWIDRLAPIHDKMVDALHDYRIRDI